MRKYWIGFWSVIIISFAILGWQGFRIWQEKPPLPDRVVTESGKVLISEDGINSGQRVWRAMGGMEVGSIWGHGSYVAPDWTADWLHRESMFILNSWAQQDHGSDYESLHPERKASLQARLVGMMRKNTFDEATNTITIPDIRAEAFESNLAHYSEVFINGNEDYSIQANAVAGPDEMRKFANFIWWSAWAAGSNRIGEEITYTNNWPHEPLINNRPSSDAIIWTGMSIIMLLGGIGLLVWWHAAQKQEPVAEVLPEQDPLLTLKPTPSQKATIKYFWVVSWLFLLQMIMGVVTAHYGVEGHGFYGIQLADFLPYVVTRTWHVQLAIFWIATAWLAAGLYIGPSVCGYEPKWQRLGVNVLFSALIVVVLGSLIGEWLSVMGHLTGDQWFYFGHQGYEYVDLGRVWQVGLFIGLCLWLWLVGRCIWAAIKKGGDQKPLMTMFLVASVAITAFYAAGFMWGKNTHLAIAEYWRWWVIHLWVEGFFEVFATVVIAFLFARLSLIRLKTANTAVVLSTTIFLTGGIVGTLHHLYFSGTPISVMALGAVFSALEVVPLTLIGIEAWDNIKIARSKPWVSRYKWPIYFFVAVAFWNLVGAGLFGFMINPPIALYYMQGLNTTPVHAHTALFGVYGMLGLGLMLFCMRVMYVRRQWKEGWIKFSFWTINIGLMAMVLLSTLPVGFLQTWESVDVGYWSSRSAEFLNSPAINFFKWMRIPGDTLFAIGMLAFVLFIFGLSTGHSLRETKPDDYEPTTQPREPASGVGH